MSEKDRIHRLKCLCNCFIFFLIICALIIAGLSDAFYSSNQELNGLKSENEALLSEVNELGGASERYNELIVQYDALKEDYQSAVIARDSLSERYDQSFDEGYDAGYQEGYSEGENVGYKSGFSAGKDWASTYITNSYSSKSNYSSGSSGSGGGWTSTSSTSSTQTTSQTVYITATGSKYHRYGCQYLSRSCYSISLSNAKSRGYTPCSRCW